MLMVKFRLIGIMMKELQDLLLLFEYNNVYFLLKGLLLIGFLERVYVLRRGRNSQADRDAEVANEETPAATPAATPEA
jgi:hypothetical protein